MLFLVRRSMYNVYYNFMLLLISEDLIRNKSRIIIKLVKHCRRLKDILII